MHQKPQAKAVVTAATASGAPEVAPAASGRGIGRRALLRGGAAAAPVLLSLHSGPVAATGTMSCTIASSFVSVATFASRNPGATTIQCSTMNASHWHVNAKSQSAKQDPQRAAWAKRTLKEYLGRTCNLYADIGNDPSQYQIWQVMGYGSGPAQSGEMGVLHHILGLALSIDAGGGVVNTGGKIHTPYLADVWRNYKNHGRYVLPASHINWSEAELISWLKMLQYPMPIPHA